MPGQKSPWSSTGGFGTSDRRADVRAGTGGDAVDLDEHLGDLRFAEYHSLQGAFGRRATIEQEKGILMARHAADADRAFEMLRKHSQHNGHKLVDVAQAIVDSHLLLLPPLPQPAPAAERPA
jgi:hypothetical protein